MSTDDSGMREQAIRWAQRMRDGDAMSDAERDAFQAWVVVPKHEEEYRFALLIMNAPADLPQHVQSRLVSLSPEGTSAVSGGSRRQLFKMMAIAASALFALVAGGVVMESRGWFGETYSTRVGQTDTVRFKEGSVAYLNTRTELRWLGSGSHRRVELTQGEALFDVVHDESRPFIVVMDGSEIRVLGTRFNVYRKASGDVTVTVLEGTVEVRGFGQGGQAEWVRKLEANQQIEYRPIGLVREPHLANAQNAVQWRSGFILINDEPLEKLIDEFTRYTNTPILIRDPRLADLRVSGAYSARDVPAALQGLQAAEPKIEVRESDGVFTLDYRAPAGK